MARDLLCMARKVGLEQPLSEEVDDSAIRSIIYRPHDRSGANVADIVYVADRGLDRFEMLELSNCAWVTERRNVVLIGASPFSSMTTLSLSRVMAENRNSYYRSFKEAELPLNHGELTPFVMNMLELVQLAQGELDLQLTQKRELLDTARGNLDGFCAAQGLGSKDADIVYMLAQLRLFATFPEASQEEIADYIGLGKQRARDYTKRLREKGMLEASSRRPLRLMLSSSAMAELGLAAAAAN